MPGTGDRKTPQQDIAAPDGKGTGQGFGGNDNPLDSGQRGTTSPHPGL